MFTTMWGWRHNYNLCPISIGILNEILSKTLLDVADDLLNRN
jgi:hypothetical protein